MSAPPIRSVGEILRRHPQLGALFEAALAHDAADGVIDAPGVFGEAATAERAQRGGVELDVDHDHRAVRAPLIPHRHGMGRADPFRKRYGHG